MTKYKIQIQFKENISNIWASLYNEFNTNLYEYDSEEEAKKEIEKLEIEYSPLKCRIIKID